MCTSKILILALASILEIDSSNIPINHRTQLWSRLQHPAAGSILPTSSLTKLSNAPKKFVRKINLTNDHRYRRKQNHLWLDPIEYKKLRSPKRSKYSRDSKKNNRVEKYKIEDTRSSENSDLPSSYLIPPKITSKHYQQYYKNSEKILKNHDSTHNRTVGSAKNHRLENETVPNDNYDHDRPIYVRDHAPEQQVEATDDRETNEGDENAVGKSKNVPKGSKDRVEFHIQGHAGPETYVFGFDTGDGENRQYRMEERHEDGTVTGQYGYIDARGKLRKVRYKASPTHGYEEKHHESKQRGT